MASRRRLSYGAASVQTRALVELLDGGELAIYAGDQPDSPDDGLSGQPLLSTCRFAATAFALDGDGDARSGALLDPNALGGGTATWFRCRTATGQTVLDGSVGTVDADLVLTKVEITRHAVVMIDEFTLRVPRF